MSQLTDARGELTPAQSALLTELDVLADSGVCQFLAKVSGHFVNLSIGACATASPTNGLQIIGADIGLGGSLTQNTAIDGDTFTYNITDLGSFSIAGTDGRRIIHNGTNVYLEDTSTGVLMGTGANKLYVKTPNVVGTTAVVGQALKLVNLTTGEVEFGTVSSAAVDITYNNVTSGLTATDVQAAIDEVVTLIGTGGITGSGVSGRVTIWNGTATVTSDADFTFDTTTNSLTAGRINLFSPTTTSMMVGPLLASAVGDYNTIGGIGSFAASTSGQYTTTWGAYTGAAATNHQFCVFNGAEAARFSSSLFGVIAIGWRAGYESIGNQNVLVGLNTGKSATGTANMLLGNNIATGILFSGSANTVGGANSFVLATSAVGVSAWGQESLAVVTTANYVASLGYRSGYTVTTGGYSVFAGATSDVSVGTVASVICIGYGAIADTNNIAVIGGPTSNGYVTDVYFGNGKENATPLAQVKIHVTGGNTSANNIIGSDVWWMAGIARGNGQGGSHFFYTSDAGSSGTTLQTSTSKFQVSVKGNVIAGSLAAVSTSATDGFFYLPTCAGTPSGTPTAYTGKDALVYDSTNDLMYIYEGGAWRTVGAPTVVDQFKTMAGDSGSTTANSPTDTFNIVGGNNIITSITGDTITIDQKQAWLIDPTPVADITADGPQISELVSSATIAAASLVYYTSSGWAVTDADAESTAKGMLAITLAAGTATNPLLVAMPGSFVRNDAWAWTVGAKLYVSTTAGEITETAPSGTGDVVRVIGFAVNADVIYFYPGDTVVLV